MNQLLLLYVYLFAIFFVTIFIPFHHSLHFLFLTTVYTMDYRHILHKFSGFLPFVCLLVVVVNFYHIQLHVYRCKFVSI